MVFKPVCCVCGQEIRPWYLFWMPTPGEHISIPCSEKEDPEEEVKANLHRIVRNVRQSASGISQSRMNGKGHVELHPVDVWYRTNSENQ